MKTPHRALFGAVLVCVGTAGAAVAQAQQMPRSEETLLTRWEVTPFLGYRMGGSFDLSNGTTGTSSAGLEDDLSFGLAINLSIDQGSSYELFYSRQQTRFEKNSPVASFDVDVEYLHLGGTLLLNDQLPIAPYMVGGVGLSRFNSSGGDDTRFSLSIGVGAKLPVTPRFAVRVEGRGYLTLINEDTAFFCASGSFGGTCAIAATGDTFFQFELFAGAAFKF